MSQTAASAGATAGSPPRRLHKTPTGISGLDSVLDGGLPSGRASLVCGGPGCGKTVLGMQFLLHGIDRGEPGVFVAFEERAGDLAANMAGFGWDIDALVADRRLLVDAAELDAQAVVAAGDYDLSALFVRLQDAIEQVGAKRLVIDTIETIFSAFRDTAVVRAELVRLVRWLKDRGITAVITAEQGKGTLTRHEIDEYVTDCVIFLDHRVSAQSSTRRLRVIKYRGSAHVGDEVPFTISKDGINVMPLASLALDYKVSGERVSSGVADLDDMLDGGYYKGSTVLVSGTAGSGKSTVAAHFLARTCLDGHRAMLFAFEESSAQIVRNMRSVGLDLDRWMEADALRIVASRPGRFGLESHLVAIHAAVAEFSPSVVVMDPVSDFEQLGSLEEGKSMVIRLLDLLRHRGITVLLTALVKGGEPLDRTLIGVSSVMDTWLYLRDMEHDGERSRAIYIIKARGTSHTNQVREFVLTSNGIELRPVYVGPAGVLFGAARGAQEARDAWAATERQHELARLERRIEHERGRTAAQIAALQAGSEMALDELSAEMERVRAAEAESAEIGAQMQKERAGGRHRWRQEDEQ